MKKISVVQIAICALVILVIGTPRESGASAIYEYTGPTFNETVYGYIPNATNMTIRFTTTDPLTPSSNQTFTIDLSTIVMSVGSVSLSGDSAVWNDNPTNWVLSTDATGLPSAWSFHFYQTIGGTDYADFSSLYHWTGYPDVDAAAMWTIGSTGHDSRVNTDLSGPGTWRIVTSAPEPTTVLLLGLGLMGLAGVRRKLQK